MQFPTSRVGGRVRQLVVAGALLAAAGLCGTDASAAVLYLDGSDQTSTTTALTGSTPYGTGASGTWNRGGTAQFGSLLYADGSAATGVTAVIDVDGAVSPSANTTLNFASSPSTAGNSGGTPSTGVFTGTPAKDFLFSGGSQGLAGVRVAGLPAGSYDVYLVAAYTGSNAANHPQGSEPSRQGVWVFAGSGTSVVYNPTANTLDGKAQTELLENSTRTAWTAGNNYVRTTVTIDATTPDLFVAASGATPAVGGTAQTEARAFINFVQIVPEPASAFAACGTVPLLLRRRRAGRPVRDR